MSEVADLYAALGLRLDKGAWAKGDAALQGARRAVDALNGAFQDKQGRWRAASGRYLTMGEKAQLAGKGVQAFAMDTKKAMGVVGLNVDKARKGLKAAGEEAARAAKKSREGFLNAGMAAKGYLGYLAGRAGYSALIGFNSSVEDTKLQIAGMLSLAKKTDLVDQLKVADDLYASLQRRAAILPGETAEYVKMAGKLTRVITDSGGSMKQLEDLTVNAVIAAKGLGENWEVAARDIEQALMGRYNTTDPFLSKVLPTIGYKGEEGRDKWRALTAKKRFAELERALMQKQFTQLGEAQGKTFSGRMSTFMDTVKQTAGEVGKGLFGQLTESLKYVNEWLDKNKDAIKDVARVIGDVLLVAFDMAKNALDIFVEGIKFFIEHSTLAKVALTVLGAALTAFAVRAAAAWVMALGPVGLIITAIMGVIAAVGFLRKHWDKIGPAIGRVVEKVKALGRRIRDFFVDDIPNAIRAAFEWLSDLPVIGRLIKLVADLRNLGTVGDTGYVNEVGNLSAPERYLSAPAASASGTTVGKIDVSVGDVIVNAPNASADEVAVKVREEVRDQLGASFLRAMDEQ